MADTPIRRRTRRAALAELAAGRILTGRSMAALRPPLRLAFLAEQLCAAAPPHALDLAAEAESVCRALGEGVRRRPGWLYCTAPADPLPVRLPRSLIQAALLLFAEGLLRGGVPGLIVLEKSGSAARLSLHSGSGALFCGDFYTILRHFAAVAGGGCVTGRAPLTAALWLPLAPGLPHAAHFTPPGPDTLLHDRFGPVALCLGGRGWLAEERW